MEDHSGSNIHAEAGGYAQKEVHAGSGAVVCRKEAMQSRYSGMNGGQWRPVLESSIPKGLQAVGRIHISAV